MASGIKRLQAQPLVVAGFTTLLVIVVLLGRGREGAGRLLSNVAFIGLNRAAAVGDLEDHDRLDGWFRTAVAINPANVSAQNGYGLLLAQEGREEEAVARWRSSGRYEDVLMTWGRKTREVKDFDSAQQWYSRVLLLNPDNGAAWFWRGETMAQQGQWQGAISDYEEALKRPSAALPQVGLSDVYCAIAWTYHWLATPADPDKAASFYELAAAQDDFASSNAAADCYFKQAELLQWKLDRPDQALLRYEEAVRRQPDHGQAASAAILLRFRQSGDLEPAEEQLMRLIRQYPDSKWGYLGLGDLYTAVNNLAQAQQQYEQASNLVPGDAQLATKLQAVREAIANDE